MVASIMDNPQENNASIEESIRCNIKCIQVYENRVFILSQENDIRCATFDEAEDHKIIYEINIVQLKYEVSVLIHN